MAEDRTQKDRATRITKKLQEEKKRSSETEDHEKQRLSTPKRLKRGDENELERKLRLEKVVASKARLENDVATRLAMETDEKRKARLEKMVQLPHSSGWPWRDRGRKKRKNGMD